MKAMKKRKPRWRFRGAKQGEPQGEKGEGRMPAAGAAKGEQRKDRGSPGGGKGVPGGKGVAPRAEQRPQKGKGAGKREGKQGKPGGKPMQARAAQQRPRHWPGK